MKDPRSVIIKPVVSEKSYGLIDSGVYTFIVAKSASKPEIRQAVEAIWKDVKVDKVNTLTRRGKTRRARKTGIITKLPDTKRAIVTLSEGSAEIEIFQAG